MKRGLLKVGAFTVYIYTFVVCVIANWLFFLVGDGDLDKRRVLLKDLNPLSLYEAFLMASTLGGSWNGSAIHFKTEPFG